MITYADRLEWAMKCAGLNPQSDQSELARRVGDGCKPQNIQYLLNHNNNAKSSKYTQHLADVLNCDAGWLAYGQGQPPSLSGAELVLEQDPHQSDAPITEDREALISRLLPQGKGTVITWENEADLPDDPERVWIDRFDYHFSAGTGVIQWEIREKKALPFDIGYFRALGSNPKDCRLLAVRGDSMEPYLFNRDMMMIDSTRTNVRDGRVYAVYFEDEPLVKQIFKQVGGGVVLHSYNSKYPDKEVPAERMDLVKVVGEVIHRSGSGLAGGN